MNIENYSRSFGFGGFMCGGLVGLLFLLYPDAFPRHSTPEGVVLIGACLGAGFQRLANLLVLKPLLFYAGIAQLTLLRRLIGEKTYNEIIRQLTIEYFLGERDRASAPSLQDDEPDEIETISRRA
jgi:hypothetical protein